MQGVETMFVGWIFLQILAFANCVSDEHFFPFGESAGDLKLPARKHAFGKVLMLNGTYSFYNTGHKQLQVYGDGIITLGKSSLSHTALKHRKFPFPPNTPSVAVFYAPIEVGKLSEVFHRETRNESVLKKATDHVRWSFTREQDFVASSVFIATWKNVIHADNRFPSKSNTFQVVLITDGQRTFSLFNYKDNGLQWIKGYHVQYQGFRFFDAQVGFSAGDQVRSYLLPGSGTRDVKLLATKSNVFYSGQWMFKIGWPNMGALNVEAADSFLQKDLNRPLYFIVDQYFKGCFKVHGYLSSNESEVWRDVSIRSCMILCHERNYRYATLHNGSQCACLNEPEYLQLERLPKEACNIRCAINDEEFCGGRAAASVFWAVGSLILSADERAAELNDMDECVDSISRCHSNASCKNTAPGYCCECNEGYTGNGIVCEKEGKDIRFKGRLFGNINGITLTGVLVDLIAITKDGRVYVIIRSPPPGLAHSLKILTPFADAIGWSMSVKNAKGVPNGFSLIGDRFTRNVVISFDTGEVLNLYQSFTGKEARGSFIAFDSAINGTMPVISPNSSVKVNSFKEVFRREDRGRVESDGTVTFEVDGQENEFSVRQNIAFDELDGCESGFYSFDVESRVLLSKYDERQKYSGVAIKSSIVNASKPETQGQQGIVSPCGPQKQTCHSQAKCLSDKGKEQCRCNDGFQGDGTRCKESPCSQKCDTDANCKEYLGSWQCVCNPGFKGNGLTCEPDGTCAGVQCSEHAQCVYAADNSRKCVCNDGYEGDGQTCAPRDKCEGVTCGANASCDARGNCACDRGFQGDGQRCKDVDECKDSSRKCHFDADCTNTEGSYSCLCKSGYFGDGFSCEKAEVNLLCNGQECHSQAQCLNRKCVCNSGYQGDGVKCNDLNECLGHNDCHTFADCTNTNGSYTCKCKQGYQGNGKECTKVASGGCGGETCHTYASCIQDPETEKQSCRCRLGFDGDGLECQDLDECRFLSKPCPDNNTECVNSLGSFDCLCEKGFIEINRKCVSDDTCMGVDCHPDAVCNPFRGCICKSGYQGDGRRCEDENECDPSRSPCDLNANCTNTKGSFECQCQPGFTGDGFRCQRVNRNCNGVECDRHARCVQSFDNSLQCECDSGWQGDGENCSDINECESFNNLCHPLRADCINTDGSYECRCKPGFQGDGFNCTSDGSCDGVQCHDNATCFKPSPERLGLCLCKDGWQGDGRTCNDTDECNSSRNSCDENADCINTVGSYRCQCQLGYQGDGRSCALENSCGGVRCDSNAECLSSDGGQSCVCRRGWSGDGQTCFDFDECQPFKSSCHFDAECINTEGSYDCRCRPGYLGDGFDCASDGTCEGYTCDDNADCNRTFPSGRRRCLCKAGWQGNGQSCSDLDECQAFPNSCHLNAECLNIQGSYSCRCRPGYQGDGLNCTSDGSCEGVFCDPNADCRRVLPEGVKQCKCREGWQGDGRNCSDVDECQPLKNICHSDAECINNEGSYECRCRPGYQGDGFNCVSDGSCDGIFCDSNAFCKEISVGSQRVCLCNAGFIGNGTHCSDVNECESSSTKCDLNANCFNTPGSFRCRCRLGYQGNGTHCVSDGTCDGVICDQNSACVPITLGGRDRQCVCLDGWTGDGRSCTDVDECQAVNYTCHRYADCVNTLGSFLCKCQLGYEGSGFECKSDGTCAGVLCHSNATCKNLIQGPTCECNDGYQGSGTECTDIDECQTDDNECHTNADCLNSIGSYTCQCKPGYQGSGVVCESDGTCAGVRCHPDAICDEEALLGPVCVCKPGYKGDGRKCTDIDECSDDDNKCHQEAECINTFGSYNCSCKPGFEGDGYNCRPDGTCAGIVCAVDAVCVTTQNGAQVCECKAGFTGNGLDCRDIDECAKLNHECHRKAKCVNQPGSYVCRCNRGYYGSGFLCSSDGTCEGVVCDYNADCIEVSNDVDPDKECRCKTGFTGNGEICTDIDECEDPTVCPDKADCFNMAGSFMCHCLPGYKMIGQTCKKECKFCLNGGSCTENNTCLCPPGFSGKGCQWHGEASLIYSKGNSIQRLSLPPRPNDVGIIYQRPGAVHVGVDYDCVEQMVYWTEVIKGTIVRAKYDGSDMEVIVNSGKTTSPEGIAVDWLGRNIYWTDSRLDAIQVANLDGTQRKTLISSDLRNPRAIIVDPPNGKMYWADWGRNRPKIEVANMDGSDRRVLVQSPALKVPNGLTLVQSTNELCYCDAGVKEICCVNLGDLSMRKVVRRALYPFGITNFNRTLFWTDWRQGRIQRMGLSAETRDSPLRSFVGSSGKIFDIKAVQPCEKTALKYENPCDVANDGCSGLCLLKAKSFSCLCPDGLHPIKEGNATKCAEKCDSPLGMENGLIENKQLSAHSAWDNNYQRYGSSRARLHLNEWPQGWRAQINDPSPWLQIDLLWTHTVTAVATQGYGSKNAKEWVKTYVLLTSRDGKRWYTYRERGRKRVFIGNVDTSSVVQNKLKMPQITRWVRIVPRSWNNHIGMRVELYGC